MKLYKLFGAALLITASLSNISCSDWLDYTPKDKVSEDQQFSTKEGFYNNINGIYNILTGSSLYGKNLSYGPIDVMGQCYNVSSSYTSLYEFSQYTWTAATPANTFSTIWSEAYKLIMNINIILNNVDKKEGTLLNTQEHDLIKGEMLALRAFIHFDLLRLFGPIYDKNPEGLSIPYNTSSTAIKHSRLKANELVSDYLLPDVIKAQELLLNSDPVIENGVLNSDGKEDGNYQRYRQLRMNYYATTLLKARIHLWTRDYTNALVEAKKITDNSKVEDWFPFVDASKLLANNTNPDRGFSTECFFGFYNSNVKDVFDDYFSGSLSPQFMLQPRTGYIDILFPNSSDYRRQSQWTGSSSIAGSGFDFVKYKGFTADSDNPEFWATFYGLMRKSEAYYIAAECLLDSDMDQACSYINVVLRHRGLEEVSSSSITQSQLLKLIKMEYLRETRGEGQIFFMFKRFFQSFGKWSGDPDLSGKQQTLDDVSSISRYVIPIPSTETN